MRCLPTLFLLVLMQACVAQTGTTPESQLPTTPDATIVVQKHQTGADIVQVTMRSPGYPTDLLRNQVMSLTKFLKREPRGVNAMEVDLDPSNPNMKFTKASFAVDGLIDREKGGFHLNELVQAFAGAPKPWTISEMDIKFESEVPGDLTLKAWRSKSLECVGQSTGVSDPRLTGVEYRIKLLKQDPATFDIPGPGQKPVAEKAKPPRDSGVDWAAITVLGVAAIAVGVLVYSLLLRSRPKPRR